MEIKTVKELIKYLEELTKKGYEDAPVYYNDPEYGLDSLQVEEDENHKTKEKKVIFRG